MKTHDGNPRARSATRGFTLLEVLVAAVVLGTSLVAATWSMNATARTQALHELADGPADDLAREIHELASGLPREPSGQVGAHSAADVLALDSLVGASFSPPILADGSVAEGLDGWSQHVDLEVHALSALDTPTDDDPAAGLPPDGDKLYRLVVEIRLDGESAGVFSWWINP